MNDYNSPTSNVTHSLLGIPFAIVVWVVVYILAYMALALLDLLRGLENDWLQKIFRELFTPGAGGYAALFAVHSKLPRAHLKFVLWAFCIPVFLFMIGLPIYMIFFLPEGWTFAWDEQIIRWLGGAATIFGAWLAQKHISEKYPVMLSNISLHVK